MAARKILVIDDDKLIRWSLLQKLGGWGYAVLEAETGGAGLRLAQDEAPDLVLLDMKLPDGLGTDFLEGIRRGSSDMPVVMMTAFGVIEDAVTAMRRGAYDYITKPFDDPKLQSTVQHALEAAALKRKISVYREIEKKAFTPGPFIAGTPEMLRILDMARRVAESETSIVLLQGESGTGKDLLARSIHDWSRRSGAPFLAINCSAIPETLLESELFGYEKGAFTDAKQQKRGLVELADEGTLFMDEIGSLSLALQAKLLRFLETHAFKRIGGLRDVEVDLRVIAATNVALEQMCAEDRFRKDLFYRLSVCPLTLPPLRERAGDILPLAAHFVDHFNRKTGKAVRGFAPEAEDLLRQYSWPGNVRELRNAVEWAMIFEDAPLIAAKHLPIRLSEAAAPPPGQPSPIAASMSLSAAERTLIERAMEQTKGNVTQAAKVLGVSRDTLRYKLKKMKEGPEGA